MAIKTLPEDFIVDEVLSAEFMERVQQAPGPFAVYHLHKRSLTTPEAVGFVAKALALPPNKVVAAGLKDKHGATSQHITVEAGVRADRLPRDLAGQSWQMRRVGFTHQPITAKAIRANRFKITLRALTRADSERLDETIARMRDPGDPRRLWAVNYYGNQRFGGARAGEGFLAPLLVRGQFEQALRIILATPHRKDVYKLKQFRRACQEGWGDWKNLAATLPRMPLRSSVEQLARCSTDYRAAFAALPYFEQQMAVEAWQSLLWNRVACRLVEGLCPPEAVKAKDDQYCRVAFPLPGVLAPEIWAQLHEMVLPVLGKNSELKEPWKAAAEAVLAEEGITTKELRIPGLDRPWFAEVERPLLLPAEEFHADNIQPDETQTKERRFRRTLHFRLPRGSYATVLLRALGH